MFNAVGEEDNNASQVHSVPPGPNPSQILDDQLTSLNQRFHNNASQAHSMPPGQNPGHILDDQLSDGLDYNDDSDESEHL